MIPFFVVDRPISLKIVRSFWATKPCIKYGLMTHALTSKNFRDLFANYPNDIIDVSTDNSASDYDSIDTRMNASELESNVIKMCDSGIFVEGRDRISHEQLFKRYDEMRADYGIMIDYFLDKEKTIDNAKKAVSLYEQGEYKFQLVLVAQGNDLNEYLDCYDNLLTLGIKHIAIGGLLRKTENSARYVHVGDENLLDLLLRNIRKKFNPEWLFTLGIYHPTRHQTMEKYGVYGADYKGWIFNYKHKREQISELFHDFIEQIPVESTKFLNVLIEKIELNETKLIEKRLVLRKIQGEDKRTKAKKDIKKQGKLLDDIYNKILKLILKQFHNDGLPDNALETYNKLVNLSKLSEQEVRFTGINNYFSNRILPKLERGIINE